ncbi:SDR family oxidoreductase [Actinophytocola sp.]|uniref:SDR family oxidoreductase n=1 Tax=Actinophytocola sp. TaxID=1872138 RepID=UPI003D6A8687
MARTALVTGGAGCATRLAADGLDVVTADLTTGADLRLDVTDAGQVATVVAEPGPGRHAGEQRARPGQAARRGDRRRVCGDVPAELATTGVLVDAVAPAMIETPSTASVEPATLDRLVSRIPMGRPGRAAEVAELAAWLGSDRCSFSTGSIHDIGGGRAVY